MTAEKSPTPASPAPAAPAPQQIGPYRVLDTLGEGGMGTVYLAEQKEPVRRRAALKVIKLGMDSRAVLTRFEAERRALAMMEHSCIATVFDAGLTQQGQPYFAMEYVKGIPITDYCDQNKLALKERIELFQRVCSGVQHAHLKGVMHRDLKPSNVLVTLQDGKPTPKIIDFGLAKATDHHLVEATLFTEQGVMLGTPEYMSPEQAGLGGLDVDTRTDVYSLGVLLYELLVGELPFARKDLRAAGMMEMQRVIREQEPVKPSTKVTSLGDAASEHAAARRVEVRELQRRLRGDLDWIVLKALEKDRTRRYETALELAGDLQRHLDFEPVLASPPSVGYRVRKFVRRYRVQCAAAAAVFAAIIGGGAAAWIGFAGKFEADQQKNASLKAESERNAIFADKVRLDEAIGKEGELYPAWPDQIEPMRAWLATFGEPLAARLPELRQKHAELRGKAAPRSDEQLAAARAASPRRSEREQLLADVDREDNESRRTELRKLIADLDNEIDVAGLEFANGNDRFLFSTVNALVRGLEEFTALAGRLAGVRQRLAWAETVQRRTFDEPRAKWDEAIAAIRASDGVRASDLYRGYRLKPQPGIVPLRMDPMSKLWEFVDLASGTPGKEIPALDPATDRWIPTGDMGVVFVLLPGGTLPPGTVDDGNTNNTSVRLGVRLDPFFLSKFEMTRGQWLRLTGRNPSQEEPGYWEDPRQELRALPVNNVSWFDCRDLAKHQGWTLPSELQWEYACRGKSTDVWWTGSSPESLVGRENVDRRHSLRVGSLDANTFGLFDMLGNVEEWCFDNQGEYGTERVGDGIRRDGRSEFRVLRGGSYSCGSGNLGSGRRNLAPPSMSDSFSFVLARTRGIRFARLSRP